MVLTALVVRLIAVALLYPGQLDPRRDHWPFGYEMGRIARSIASGHGFGNPLFGETGPSAWIAPVFPYLLAGVFKLFGIYTKASALVILSLNSLFSALTCLPIFFLARRFFGARAALWSGCVWAVFPYAVYVSATSMWETSLLTLFLTLLLLISFRLEESNSWSAWIGCGVLWGVAALTNPVVFSVLPVLGAWVCCRLHQRAQKWFAPAATAALLVVITIAPWLARNYLTFHRPIFLKDNFWLAFRVGNSGTFRHWWNDSAHPAHNDAELDEMRRVGEVNYMAEKRAQSIQWLRQNPGLFAWISLRRAVYLWTGYWSFHPDYLEEEPYDPENIVFAGTLTVLALWGLWRAFRDRSEAAWPLALVLLSFPLAYYVVAPEFYYRHPLDPEIVILAVYAVRQRIQTSRRSPPA